MRPLHIAVLDEELPFPLTSGKRIRTYSLLSRLAKRHRITILCHRNPNPEESASAEARFRKLGIKTVVVDHTIPSKTGPAFYARLARNLLSPLPYSVTTHSSAALASAVCALAREDSVDVWHCEWTPYAQVLRDALEDQIDSVKWTVMAHNVESLIWQRYREMESSPAKRWYIHGQWMKFERFERWAYNKATLPIAVSHEDARLMTQQLGVQRAEVIENGVDVEYFRPQRDVERDPAKLLFLGSLDWRPNLDGVLFLIDKVFPKVREKTQRASLLIVGRRPPEWLKQRVASAPGVRVIADVPDVRPSLATSGMLVVPLRIGGGSRLKILEALAMETPVLSTSVGAEGLQLTPDRDLVVSDGPSGLTDAILRAIDRPDEFQEMAERGRSRVVANYSWDPLAARLGGVWETLASRTVWTIL